LAAKQSAITDALRSECEVPEKYAGCRLHNFDRRNEFPWVVPFLEEHLARVSSPGCMSDNGAPRGLYLHGPVGTGKTHLAVASMAFLLEHDGVKGRFASVAGFTVAAQTSWGAQRAYERDQDWQENGAAPDDVGDLLFKQTGYLAVFDDLGVERATPFTRQILDAAFEGVYAQNGILIVTSNLDLDQLAGVYPRIADRIAETCHVLRLQGESYRMIGAKQRAALLDRKAWAG
jgi:predicted ATPase